MKDWIAIYLFVKNVQNSREIWIFFVDISELCIRVLWHIWFGCKFWRSWWFVKDKPRKPSYLGWKAALWAEFWGFKFYPTYTQSETIIFKPKIQTFKEGIQLQKKNNRAGIFVEHTKRSFRYVIKDPPWLFILVLCKNVDTNSS